VSDGAARRLDTLGVHTEAVVLAGDLHPPSLEVSDRMIGTTVAKAQLEGVRTQRTTEQLMPQADAHHRDLTQRCLDLRDHTVERGRISGAIGQENKVTVGGPVTGRRAGRKHIHGQASLSQQPKNILLDAAIHHRHTGPRAGRLREGVGLLGADHIR
jgi:hypothetical protein